MNILIGSCGGLTGQYLIKQYRRMNPAPRIIGYDMNYYCYSRTICDEFLIAPSVTSESKFLEFLINSIIRLDVSLFIPTLSNEIKLIAQHSEYLRKQTNCYFLVSPYETFLQLDDKFLCYRALGSIGIDVPRIYENIDEITSYPVFVKPRIGSGGKGSYKADSRDDVAIKDSRLIIVEYLQGEEFTVDCLFDSHGYLLSMNARTREKTLGGAAVISRNVSVTPFSGIINKISESFTFCGCANFQFIRIENRVVCIDVNLRFPSGGLPLSVESGMNIPMVLHRWAQGMEVDESQYHNDNKQRIMYRYFEEAFELL